VRARVFRFNCHLVICKIAQCLL